MTTADPITLTVTADPHLARLVRMTASNVALLSSMTVERVEDVRMAAEEAFIYACAAQPDEMVSIAFTVDGTHLAMSFALATDEFPALDADDPTSAYTDLILGAVCDSYERLEGPARLELDLKADA